MKERSRKGKSGWSEEVRRVKNGRLGRVNKRGVNRRKTGEGRITNIGRKKEGGWKKNYCKKKGGL